MAVVAAGACGEDAPDDPASEPIDLDGREYLADTVEGHQLVERSELRVRFAEGQVNVSAGCNNMFGAYSIDDDRLVVEPMASTEMACAEPLMEQDAWVAAFLEGGPRVTVDGETLTLTGEEATITFVDREVAEPDLPLEGTRWVVDGLVANDAVSSMPAGVVASVTIAGGRADVEAGCNTGSAPAEVGDGTIVFGALALTRKMCEPATMSVEQIVVATLEGEVAYEIESSTLRLTRTPGSGEVTGLVLHAGP